MKQLGHTINVATYGSPHSSYHNSFDSLEAAKELGKSIIRENCTLSIPASSGFPFWVAKGAKEEKGQVIAFSPGANRKEHHDVYDLPSDYMDIIIYSGFGYAGADLLLSRSCDAIIFGYGGLETVHEFWVAFQENKPIGILQGKWDTDEILFTLLKGREEQFDHNRILFGSDPSKLVQQLIKKVKKNL